ncbi:MAG TPA: acyl-CoA dehydrogenase family protein, partial [Candidatus Sulfotelmatobacter sp.]
MSFGRTMACNLGRPNSKSSCAGVAGNAAGGISGQECHPLDIDSPPLPRPSESALPNFDPTRYTTGCAVTASFLPLTRVPHPCYRHMFALQRAPVLSAANGFSASTKHSASHFIQETIMPAIKFRGVDFIQYDALLTDEERLVRDTTRQFIEDNLIPIIEECNRAGRFPRELIKPMADLGFFG